MPASNDQPSTRDRLRGFGLGTAILTVTQLKDIHTRLNQAFKQLNDPTITYLLDSLVIRLKAAGVDVENLVPLRAFANRSIIDSIKELDSTNPSGRTLIHQQELKKVEDAILNRNAVHLKILDRDESGNGKEIRVWPLQILFHNIAWYLAYESMGLDRLLTVTRLDRVHLINGKLPDQRNLTKMQESQQRLEHLCRRTGGIYLGDDHLKQAELAKESLSEAKIQQLICKKTLVKVQFSCSPRIYAFIRSGNKRFPSEQMRLSGPLPTDSWTLDTDGIQPLDPDPSNTSHPYPVELILPGWTINSTDFKRWLFGFGADLKIKEPVELRKEHQVYGQGIAKLYDTPEAKAGSSPAAEDS